MSSDSEWVVPDSNSDDYTVIDAAVVPPLRRMTDEDYALGATLYAMVEQWSGWVHRRVERVTFDDAVASQRHVSIDCTLRAELSVPLLGQDEQSVQAAQRLGQRLFYVPLSMHLKHRVTRLSVRDESGAPLPVLTQARCAYFGTATLAVAAMRVWAKSQRADQIPDRLVIPPDVLADLDYMATQHWRLAVARWAVFPWIPSTERTTTELELRGTGGNPMTTRGRGQSLVPLSAEALVVSRKWRQLLTDPQCVESTEFVALANDFARNYLMLVRVWDDGRRRRVFKVSFEEQRRVPPPYVLSKIRRALGRGRDRRPQEIPSAAGWITERGALWSLSEPDVQRSPRQRLVRLLMAVRTLQTKGLRALAVKAKVYRIPAPALARCECYHLEIEAPDGLQITGGRLRAVAPSDPSNRDKAPHIDKVDRSVQRVHLHLAGVPQGQTGEAVVALRPRAWNVLLAACTASFLTAVLLVIIGSSWAEISENNVNASALLLALPGGLGFFVARRTESGLVTATLRGVRVLAFLTGVWALGGAAVVVADPVCMEAGDSWLLGEHADLGCAPDYLWFLAILALLTWLPLVLATWRAWDPPLRREIDEQDYEDFDLGSELERGRR